MGQFQTDPLPEIAVRPGVPSMVPAVVHAAVLPYARVSSKDQEGDSFSIPAQCKLLNEYATGKLFVVVREFQEAETAKEAEGEHRPRAGFALVREVDAQHQGGDSSE